MNNLKPLRGYCLVEPLEEEETTASGLVMPERSQDKPSKGKILAIGAIPYEDMKLAIEVGKMENQKLFDVISGSIEFEEGDTVIYHKWATQDVKEEGKILKLVKFGDLMAVYEE